MGEIWEIILSQSGHHSWLSQAAIYPSILTHEHTHTHTNIHPALNSTLLPKCKGTEGWGLRGNGKVLLCLIRFFFLFFFPPNRLYPRCLSSHMLWYHLAYRSTEARRLENPTLQMCQQREKVHVQGFGRNFEERAAQWE